MAEEKIGVLHERLAKGGIVMNNGVYRCELPLLVDWLYEKKIITQDGHSAALNIISLREVAFSPNAYAKMKALSQWLGRGVTEDCPLTRYTAVMRGLSVSDRHIIERITADTPSQKYIEWIKQNPQRVSLAFDNLYLALTK